MHLLQGGGQVKVRPGVLGGSEKGGADHGVVLRAVHMAEGEVHHLFEDGDGVPGGLPEAEAVNGVQPLGVAVRADIVALHTPGLAGLGLAADGAGHGLVLGEVLQGSLTDETFFLHGGSSLVVFTQYTTSFDKREWGTFFAETPCNTGLFPL